jgi:predicted peroxiredoxin
MPNNLKTGLTIILECADAGRVRLAYEMVLVQRALDKKATLFFTGASVGTLERPDAQREAALEAGARLIACQTALAEAGLSMTRLDVHIEAGGLVSLMQGLGEGRLVVI